MCSGLPIRKYEGETHYINTMAGLESFVDNAIRSHPESRSLGPLENYRLVGLDKLEDEHLRNLWSFDGEYSPSSETGFQNDQSMTVMQFGNADGTWVIHLWACMLDGFGSATPENLSKTIQA